MDEEEVAAVIAAARLIGERAYAARNARADRRVASWNVAGRIATDDTLAPRLIARVQSRWALSGRLRD